MTSAPTSTRSVNLLYVATALYWASMYVYVPILPVHAENLGASAGLIGMVVGAYGFSQLVLRIPIGVWSDKMGARKPFIYLGIAAACLGALGMGLAPDPTWLVVGRAVSGVGASAWVVFSVLFSSYFAPDKAPHAMSRISFVSGSGQVVATYAGGLIAQYWGWRAPFFVGVALAILCVAVATRVEEKPLPVRRGLSVGHVFRTATVPLLLVAAGISMLGSWTQWATVNGFSLVYAARLGASRTDLGTLTTLMQLGHMAGPLVAVFMQDRVGVRLTIVLGLAMQSVGAFMVPVTDSLLAVAGSQVLGGMGRGVYNPILMGLSIRSVSSADRATAMGVYQAVYALGMFAGPASTGFLGDFFGLSSIFIVAGLAPALGFAVVMTRVPEK